MPAVCGGNGGREWGGGQGILRMKKRSLYDCTTHDPVRAVFVLLEGGVLWARDLTSD